MRSMGKVRGYEPPLRSFPLISPLPMATGPFFSAGGRTAK